MSSSLFWCSLLELAGWALAFILFISDSGEMAFIWIHLPHIPRALIGFYLLHNIPKSHDLAAQLSIPQDEKLPFEQVISHI